MGTCALRTVEMEILVGTGLNTSVRRLGGRYPQHRVWKRLCMLYGGFGSPAWALFLVSLGDFGVGIEAFYSLLPRQIPCPKYVCQNGLSLYFSTSTSLASPKPFILPRYQPVTSATSRYEHMAL